MGLDVGWGIRLEPACLLVASDPGLLIFGTPKP